MNDIGEYRGDAAIVLVGLKSDLRDEMVSKDRSDSRIVTTEMGYELKTKIKAQDYVECSAKTTKNLAQVFQSIGANALHPPPKQDEALPSGCSICLLI
jgi:Ras-related C3 botulinum toxin substrate 1